MTTRTNMLVALSFLLLAGCGGESPTATNGSAATPPTALKTTPPASPASTTKPACPLFAAADAQALLGVAVGTGVESDGERGCTYKSADGSKYASLVIKKATSYSAIASSFAMKTPVPGVGDEAVRKDDSTGLLAHNASVSVLVSVNPTLANTKSPSAILAGLVDIAKKALAAA